MLRRHRYGERYNRRVRIALALLVLLPAMAIAQPLVITAPAAPGGGWDQTARAMQRVLIDIEHGANVQVDNVPGAAGTIGLARFIQSERGNPHALLVTGLVMVSGVIINQSPVSLANTTPIARLTGEYEIIVVPSSSSYRSIGDLVAAFKNNPGAVSWGGGSAGGTDDLLIRLLAEQIGLPASRVNYIAFPGGGAALAAVLGGQLSAAVSGYAEFAGQIEAGQLRVLAVSAPSRVHGIDAPTLRESGIALDLANWRAIVAPPGVSDAEQRSLIDRIARMAASAQWKSALERNGWDDQFLAGPAFRQFLLSEQSRIDDVLRRLAAAETQPASAFAITMTPMTLPLTTGAIFIFVLGLTIVNVSRRSILVDPTGRRMIITLAFSLIVLPMIFVSGGFVAASTLLFAISATTLRARRPSIRHVAADVIIGALFSILLFVVFTRGLGVSLPGPAF
jgi:putative tricarboxylic transport membrane protein